MSENRPNDKTEGQPDDSEPNPQRQAEVEAAHEENIRQATSLYVSGIVT